MDNNPIIEQENSENVDSKQLPDNEFVQHIMNSKIFKFLSNDTSGKITLATTAVALGSFFIRVLAYLKLKGYLSVFSMSIRHVDFSANQGFSEFLMYAVFFIGLMMGTAVIYLNVDHFWFSHRIRKAANSILKQSIWKKIVCFLRDTISFAPVSVVTFLLLIWFNYLLCLLLLSPVTTSEAELKDWIMIVAFLMVSETAIACILFATAAKKKKGRTKEDEEQEEKNQAIEELAEKIVERTKRKTPVVLNLAMSFVSIAVFVYSAMAYWGGILEANQTKNFSIIEEKYAIIYQTSETFWTVACAEDNGILTLDTSKQKIISADDIEIQKRTFSDVVIEYE